MPCVVNTCIFCVIEWVYGSVAFMSVLPWCSGCVLGDPVRHSQELTRQGIAARLCPCWFCMEGMHSANGIAGMSLWHTHGVIHSTQRDSHSVRRTWYR
ncbi:uncharacterized protein ASPGLDRAFT_52221 [Aspergillus glaucus CBS 516.65]|uniref:Uncharacterized protein n=1 Tax=Aspergillus glaucus CBS 516.65 TaxID=1160497 RepID=A0A1L9V716_ASPGL|nr:hypothetical protein ASPGLDRAFT_52221 [Aspergillus glaucus CBS 516.65]OJJ79696.1 hypothetical protein ASPGLDRAFT_52221 [Aspergillus glaucus CBS 516.65]